MKRLTNFDILDGQMLLAAATRHLANRAGRYDETGLVMPEAEGRALVIMHAKWSELEAEKLARATRKRGPRRSSRRAAA